MSQTLTIELADELYEVLEGIAKGLGKTPEEIGAQWIIATIEEIRDEPAAGISRNIGVRCDGHRRTA